MISIINDAAKIIKNGYLYIDKTLLIRDLIDCASEAILFTRQRRFGKSVNMSMLKAFFEIDSDKTLFENLESGQGRFDIQMEPKRGSLPGIVIELKAIQSEFKDAAARDARLTAEAESALDQIEKNEYTTSLKMRGVENIILYGMAFHGKYVRVQSRSSLSNSKAAASMPISEAIQRGWIS